jgi:hypothetical protein
MATGRDGVAVVFELIRVPCAPPLEPAEHLGAVGGEFGPPSNALPPRDRSASSQMSILLRQQLVRIDRRRVDCSCDPAPARLATRWAAPLPGRGYGRSKPDEGVSPRSWLEP